MGAAKAGLGRKVVGTVVGGAEDVFVVSATVVVGLGSDSPTAIPG